MKEFYFVDKNRKRQGPIPLNELTTYDITPDTLVYIKGETTEWVKACDVEEFRRQFGEVPSVPTETGQSIETVNTTSADCHIGFMDAVRICMKEKYASFQGRASRCEFWYFALFCFIAYFTVAIVGAILGAVISGGDSDSAAGMMVILYGIASLVMICPGISVFVRRLHDTGRSGWWYWLGLVPYIGGIVLFVFCCLSSQKEDNEYGPYQG